MFSYWFLSITPDNIGNSEFLIYGYWIPGRGGPLGFIHGD